jgi:hypothetical protein
MTEHDRQPFAELLLAIGETYGEPVSDARLEIYFRALSDLDFTDVRSAADIHVRMQKFFPRPAELREAVEGSVEDQAELAWSHVRREIRRVGYLGVPSWPDEATRRAAHELYGGWTALCSNLPAEGVGLVTAAKQFKATYGAYARLEAHEAICFPTGRDEAKAQLVGIRNALNERGLPS